MKCEKCKIEYIGKYGSGRFCSAHCAHTNWSTEKRLEMNKKVSNTLMSHKYQEKRPIKLKIQRIEITCIECNNSFIKKITSKQKLCSKKCAHIWTNRIRGRIGGKRSAEVQAENRRSKNEVLFAELCKKEFEEVKTNERLFNGWDADIILPEFKIAILWNGKWHREKITKKHSVEQVKNRDKIKKNEIENAGYECYIIEDNGKFNQKFVENKFNIFKDYVKTK